MAGVDDRAVGSARRRRRRRPGSARPSRSASASPTGRCAAARRPHSASSRSSDSARCAPRLFGATAWISSTITVRVVASMRAAGFRAEQDVERLRRRDEDVRRRAGACASRSACGVSPVRTAVRIVDVGQALRRAARRAMPASGASRFLLDVVRQRLQRRDVDDLRLVRRAPPADALRAPARRSRRGTRPASCPSRSAPRSARARPAWIAGHACCLRRGRRGEAALEPGGDGGVKQGSEGHGLMISAVIARSVATKQSRARESLATGTVLNSGTYHFE